MLKILLAVVALVIVGMAVALYVFAQKVKKGSAAAKARKAAKDRRLQENLKTAEVEYVVKQIERELDEIREAGQERDLERGPRLWDLKKLLTRVAENRTETLSLETVCERAVAAFTPPSLEQRVLLDISGTDTGALVTGDAELLEWAVGEMLGNVVQHGGTWSTIRVRLHANGESIVLSVEDDGNGPDEATASRLYGAFTPKTDSTGPGLGLFVVFRVIRRMGGTMDATRSPEGGLAHEIRLPRAPAVSKIQSF